MINYSPPAPKQKPVTVGNGLSVDNDGTIVLGGKLDRGTQIDATGFHLLLLADNGTSMYFAGGEIFIGSNDAAGNSTALQQQAGSIVQLENVDGASGNNMSLNMSSGAFGSFELTNDQQDTGVRMNSQPGAPNALTLATNQEVVNIVGPLLTGSTNGPTSFPANLINFNVPAVPADPVVYEIGINISISAFVAGAVFGQIQFTDLNGNAQTVQIGPNITAVGDSFISVFTIELPAGSAVVIGVNATVFTNTFSASAYCRQVFTDV